MTIYQVTNCATPKVKFSWDTVHLHEESNQTKSAKIKFADEILLKKQIHELEETERSLSLSVDSPFKNQITASSNFKRPQNTRQCFLYPKPTAMTTSTEIISPTFHCLQPAPSDVSSVRQSSISETHDLNSINQGCDVISKPCLFKDSQIKTTNNSISDPTSCPNFSVMDPYLKTKEGQQMGHSKKTLNIWLRKTQTMLSEGDISEEPTSQDMLNTFKKTSPKIKEKRLESSVNDYLSD